ncbi:RnfABCDGE type electron transport complex subunit D [Alicyclobacillus sp. SO9]|uniref:RnfABCDGE type electron transport complex subunit D n=1 Tax=Alicyclobacillus sp. SO9 TaxID=2665646 RepID=UPI0018E784E9|nr:RnfABCDGE type electron transport complex subunit D [Alicyclobacillus sp. SO9]QQE81039.1 RnfABCDGE type electron transport complex subunit D [Alicyclobacillus sp. SO9]
MSSTSESLWRQSSIRKYLKKPKGLVMLVLTVLTLFSLLNPHQHHGFLNAVYAVGTGVLFDLAVSLFQRPFRLISDGGIITGLIVADILSSTSPAYAVIATTAIALLSKHVLRIKRKPILNPAAFGLLLSAMIFPTGQSWWGSLALMPALFIVLLVGGGLWVAVRVNKLPEVFAFLGTYFVLLLVMGMFHLGLSSDTPGDALRTPFINSALFLAFFMLTDPPTSPAKYGHQVVFGIVAAAISTLVFAIHGGLTYLYIGLLLGNVWKAWKSRSPKKVKSKTQSFRVPSKYY